MARLSISDASTAVVACGRSGGGGVRTRNSGVIILDLNKRAAALVWPATVFQNLERRERGGGGGRGEEPGNRAGTLVPSATVFH